MASIRRTLSPVPKPGTLLSGEACSTASPLSKSSSCDQNYPSSGGSLSSSFSSLEYALYKVQSFIRSLFSQRSSRAQERPRGPKLKGQLWRRALFHFSLCFIVGVFVGFTPFVSMSLSNNLMPRQGLLPSDQERVNPEDRVDTVILRPSSPVNKSGTQEPEANDKGPVNLTSNSTNSGIVQNYETDKFLIIVTPTYSRPIQAYYLNRLAHTLKLVRPPLLWIVVEMTSQSAETAEILRRTGVMYRHLVCKKNRTEIQDPKVHQRNVALLHIETHRLDGIVYFADDSNVYSAELFEQMRKISRFGTWTIAKLMQNKNQAMLEGPICNGTRVIGWHTHDAMRRYRRFHADISGFAFNSTILWDPNRWHRPTAEPIRQSDRVKDGFQVSTFIEQVVEDETEMEGLPNDCSKVLVWRLHIKSSSYPYPHEWSTRNNLDAIVPLTS